MGCYTVTGGLLTDRGHSVTVHADSIEQAAHRAMLEFLYRDFRKRIDQDPAEASFEAWVGHKRWIWLDVDDGEIVASVECSLRTHIRWDGSSRDHEHQAPKGGEVGDGA